MTSRKPFRPRGPWPLALLVFWTIPPLASFAAPPNAALTVRPGEVRLEGTLRGTDAAHQMLVLLVTRAQDPGRPALDLDPPRPKDILIRPSTALRPAAGAKASLEAFQPGDAVIVIGRSLGGGKPLVARLVAAPDTAPVALAPVKSGAAAVRQFLAARAAGRYADAYALLSPDTQRMVPLSRFETAADLPRDPNADGMTPLLTAISALFIDTHNTRGYRFQVMGTAPGDPSLVLVRAVAPSGPPFALKIATVPDGGGQRLDVMRSFTRTDPHALEMARSGAEQMSSLSNLKQIGLGIMQYAQDHANTLPDADKWVDEIMPYVKSEMLFHDPQAPAGQKWSYAYNTALSGVRIGAVNTPASTVIVFESTLGTKNASDGGASVPHPGWYKNGADYGFVDGHVKWLADAEKPSFAL